MVNRCRCDQEHALGNDVIDASCALSQFNEWETFDLYARLCQRGIWQGVVQ
jgi:hypothetical protein